MEKNWYAVITADILYSKELSSRQKLLCAVISNLSNDKGYCFATNSYFSEVFDCSKRTIQDDLKVLEDLGFINRVISLHPNGEIEYRALTPMRDISYPHAKSRATPHAKSRIYNNKDINNKYNNLNIIPKNSNFTEDIDINSDLDNHIKEQKKEKEKSCAKKEKCKDLINLFEDDKVYNCYDNCVKFFEQDLRPTTQSQINKWLHCIDKLHRIDNLEYSDIELIVQKTRKDEFWKKNFLTLLKLRRQDRNGIPYWKVFREQFKVKKSNIEQTFNAYEQAKKDLGL